MAAKKRDLPKYITKTKYGYHVRMTINGEYHAQHFNELILGRKKALELAKQKRKEFIAIKESMPEKGPKKYETRFLYENAHNSTGIIGVFYRFQRQRTGEKYPYFSTTVVTEKDHPETYQRSIRKWGEGEALLQICCIRKRRLFDIYGDRFDAERFDKSVINYMKENYLSYIDDAKKRLLNCIPNSD